MWSDMGSLTRYYIVCDAYLFIYIYLHLHNVRVNYWGKFCFHFDPPPPLDARCQHDPNPWPRLPPSNCVNIRLGSRESICLILLLPSTDSILVTGTYITAMTLLPKYNVYMIVLRKFESRARSPNFSTILFLISAST